MLALGVFAATFALYGLVAVRAQLGVSRPRVFVASGALVAAGGWAHPLPQHRPAVLLLHVAEVAFTLVLFADASHLGFGRLRRDVGWRWRLVGRRRSWRSRWVPCSPPGSLRGWTGGSARRSP